MAVFEDKKYVMRILLLDSENAPNFAATWGIHEQSLRYADIEQEWFFISLQWQFLEDKKVSHISVINDVKRFIKDHTDDYIVVKKAHELLQECDVVVGHHIKGHDLKKLEAKFIEHKLPPIDMPYIVDTLQWAKKFGFTSRKLGDLCSKLGLIEKLDHEPGIFKLAGRGDVKAIRKIVKYGIGDIPTLKALYLRLRPYMRNHPNQNKFKKYPCCPSCGGARFHKRGMNRTGEFQTYSCYDCHHRFQDTAKKKIQVRYK